MRSLKNPAVALVMCALLALVGGCGESTTEPALREEPVVDLPFPGTADQAAANLRGAYERMDLDEMDRLLAPGYVMPLQVQAAIQFPDLGGAIERQEAMRIHERLFSGQKVTDPQGSQIPAVTAISLHTFQRVGAWQAVPPGSAYPGTQAAVYDIVMLMDRGQGLSLLKVQGALVLHVASRDSLVGGNARPFFELRAITDLTNDSKGVENPSLGRVLALWR